MKVTLVSEAVWPERKGGLERWFDAISSFLVENGHEITFLNSSGVTEKRNGVTFSSVSNQSWKYIGDGKRSKLQALKFSASIFSWLRKKERQVVYCSSVPILSVLAAALSPRKILIVEWFEVWTLRYWIRYSGFILGLVGWIIQLLALQVGDYRLVYSDRAHKSVKKLGRINGKSVLKMPGLCPVNLPSDVSKIEKVSKDFYYLGRFVAEKQPFLAIDAARKLSETGWTGKLWLLGTGPLYLDLKKYIDRHDLEKIVSIIDNPDDNEVLRIVSQCCALLHPSRREGFGLAPVEAAYLGVPSILINYSSNAAVELKICPELTARNDSISELVSKMDLALKNQGKYRLQVLAWSKFAREKMSVLQTLEIIHGILKSQRKP